MKKTPLCVTTRATLIISSPTLPWAGTIVEHLLHRWLRTIINLQWLSWIAKTATLPSPYCWPSRSPEMPLRHFKTLDRQFRATVLTSPKKTVTRQSQRRSMPSTSKALSLTAPPSLWLKTCRLQRPRPSRPTDKNLQDKTPIILQLWATSQTTNWLRRTRWALGTKTLCLWPHTSAPKQLFSPLSHCHSIPLFKDKRTQAMSRHSIRAYLQTSPLPTELWSYSLPLTSQLPRFQ